MHLQQGPGHVLSSTAVGSAQVLALIRGLNSWQAQDAPVDLSLLRELAARAPWRGDMSLVPLGWPCS
jgi:hypothetical protein